MAPSTTSYAGHLCELALLYRVDEGLLRVVAERMEVCQGTGRLRGIAPEGLAALELGLGELAGRGPLAHAAGRGTFSGGAGQKREPPGVQPEGFVWLSQVRRVCLPASNVKEPEWEAPDSGKSSTR